MNRIKELGRKVVCITNHDNLFAPPFYQTLCKKDEYKDIKPIFGCEMRLIEDMKNNPRQKTHLTVIAQNDIGYKNLARLVTASNNHNCFYYLPCIDLRMLKECSEGLIVFSGCLSGMLSRHILDNDLVSAVKLTKWFKNVFGDRFYLEAVCIDMDETQVVAPAIRALHKKLDIPLVLTNDVHFLNKGGDRVWKMLQSIKFRMPIAALQRDPPNSCYYMEDEEAWQHAKKVLGPYFDDKELYEMFANQEKIASDANATIQKPGSIRYGVDDPIGLLKHKVQEGWTKRKLKGGDYRDRVHKEMDMIVRKGYADYFLAISDIVNWAKDGEILVGPSRGSAGCSLIAYIMGITEVDPIRYDLVMERFLSEDRIDLPDIDLDFEHIKRYDVIEHIRNKFGAGNVAQMCTFIKFKGKNSLGEIGKMFGIPRDKVEAVQNVLVSRGTADARASFTIEDTFNEFPMAKRIAEQYPEIRYASVLEGQIRHIGIHAAGVVISNNPLIESTALLEKEDSEGRTVMVASLDGYSAVYLGLLKVDILALKELSQLKDIATEVGLDPKCIYDLPQDDEDALKIFNGDTLGVFQFGATGTASVAKQLSIDKFDDVVLCNALCLSEDSEVCKITYDKNACIKKWQRIGDIQEYDDILSVAEDGSGIINSVTNVWHKGKMPVYRVVTDSGRMIETTLDHGFMTPNGWRKLSELSVGDELTICHNVGHIGSHPTPWNRFGTKETDSSIAKYADKLRGMPKSEEYKANKSIEVSKWHKDHPEESKYRQKCMMDGVRNWWKKITPEHKKEFLGKLQKLGTEAAKDKWNRCTDEERAHWVSGLLEYGSQFGNKGYAVDGHYCSSLGELELDNWLYLNEIDHVPHPPLPGYWRFADQLVGDNYIEFDGMCRYTDEDWGGKLSLYKEMGLSVIIVREPEEFEEKLGFLRGNGHAHQK